MTKFKKQLVAAVSAGSMFLSMASPVFATSTIEISGNGYNSDNDVDVNNNSSTTVVQTNTAIVTNSVNSSASTGGNDANQNTGGDVLVSTGDAASGTSISNLLNSNKASVDCCDSQGFDVLISGNGAYSDNDVDLGDSHHREQSENSDILVTQDNLAVVTNVVDAQAKTGYNDANQNTGGDVLVATGDATSWVEVSTTANANWANVGNDGDQGSLSARILGNGANSDNDIDLELDKDITLVQNNVATITNAVAAAAKTGSNDANQNTGGDVLIATGDAETGVEIDNMVNFNWADIDCGCVTDLLAKISGNGVDSDNDIDYKLENDLYVPQVNTGVLTNALDGLAKTGYNDADQNTGPAGSDPGILTGDAVSFSEISNTGNLNSFGDWGNNHSDWPDFDFEFSLSLNWSNLWSLLSM